MTSAYPSAPAKPYILRILVVEDRDDLRDVMAKALRATGDHVIALAKTAEEGLQLLRSGPYDLILTDIGLPGMSGLEMLDVMRSEGLVAGSTTVVVCSANHWQRRRALERGASFLPKPARIEDIFLIVRRLTDAARLESGVTRTSKP